MTPDRPRRRTGAALLLAAGVLAGCGAGAGIYGKPGVTYPEWRRDDAECRALATDAASRLDQGAHERCMRERGYPPVRPPP